jgi:hypothetical protein
VGEVKNWRRRLQGVPGEDPPIATDGAPPPVINLMPYAEPVPRKDYLAAWHEIGALPAGIRIKVKLHEMLASVFSETCPVTLRTTEERSIWLANHDGRKQILQMLAREAYLNVKLLGAPVENDRFRGPSA